MVKRKRVDTKKVFWVVFCLAVALVVYLSWSARKSEMPVQLFSVIDGNTVVFSGGKTVRLLGVEMTQIDTELKKQYLSAFLRNKNIWLEYDKYLKDESGFDLVWMWVGCEGAPKFWAVRGEGENPVNCKKGAMVNEQLIKMGMSKVYFPDNNIGVRYERRLYSL